MKRNPSRARTRRWQAPPRWRIVLAVWLCLALVWVVEGRHARSQFREELPLAPAESGAHLPRIPQRVDGVPLEQAESMLEQRVEEARGRLEEALEQERLSPEPAAAEALREAATVAPIEDDEEFTWRSRALPIPMPVRPPLVVEVPPVPPPSSIPEARGDPPLGGELP